MTLRTRVLCWLSLAALPGLGLFAFALSAGADTTRLVTLAGLLVLHVGAVAVVVRSLERCLFKPIRSYGHEPADGEQPTFDCVLAEVKAIGNRMEALTGTVKSQEATLDTVRREHAEAIREIHHRVKNNLQVVSSLLSLQASRLQTDEARSDFAMARQRLSALALLHRHLYDDRDFQSVPFDSFVGELLEHLREIAGRDATRGVRFELDAPDVRVSANQAVAIGLLITEAATNAIRHAFPHGRPGKVRVYLTVDGQNAVVGIEDDGVGLPTGRLESTKRGLGALLISGFVRQLRGKLTVASPPGTRLEVAFPLEAFRDPGSV